MRTPISLLPLNLISLLWTQVNCGKGQATVTVFACFWHVEAYGVGWGGLVRTKLKEACRRWICSEQIINFFSPCTLLNLLERNTSSRSVILAPGQHAKFCHLCSMAKHLYYMLHSGIGLDPAILITTSGGYGCGKGKGLYSSPSEVLGEVWEQGACSTCLEQGFFSRIP